MHLACLPFPSAQGTQAAIASLLEALSERGEDATLMTYPFGDDRLASPVEPLRPRLFTLGRSLRSGPSLAKLILDAQLIRTLRQFDDHHPIIAHHVEAAWAARLAGREYHYIAHTSVEDELEAYFPRLRHPRSRRALRAAGALLDRVAIEGAIRCAAVSPSLTERLSSRYRRPFAYLPIPWRLPPLLSRGEARAALRLKADDLVLLYTGNLDAYQRWELGFELADQLRRSGRDVVYLIGTESGAGIVHDYAQKIGFRGAYRVCGCALEEERAQLHGAADLALIPRRLEGGVPIKLLDALARDRPVLISAEASAGLSLGDDVAIIDSGRAEDYAAAAERILSQAGGALGSGREFIARAHSKRAAVEAFRALVRPAHPAGLPPRSPLRARELSAGELSATAEPK